MPLRSYAMSLDLIEGLEALSARERIPINELVRKAVRRELEREGILCAGYADRRSQSFAVSIDVVAHPPPTAL
jgi:hypothetical protein